ncbi:MAG: hypothetical protein ACRBB4_15685 [Neptuniibacter sp.]
MTPLNIFLIPGLWAFNGLLAFFQIEPYRLEPGLALVFSFFLSLLFWSWLVSVTITIIKRQFGSYGSGGR